VGLTGAVQPPTPLVAAQLGLGKIVHDAEQGGLGNEDLPNDPVDPATTARDTRDRTR